MYSCCPIRAAGLRCYNHPYCGDYAACGPYGHCRSCSSCSSCSCGGCGHYAPFTPCAPCGPCGRCNKCDSCKIYKYIQKKQFDIEYNLRIAANIIDRMKVKEEKLAAECEGNNDLTTKPGSMRISEMSPEEAAMHMRGSEMNPYIFHSMANSMGFNIEEEKADLDLLTKLLAALSHDENTEALGESTLNLKGKLFLWTLNQILKNKVLKKYGNQLPTINTDEDTGSEEIQHPNYNLFHMTIDNSPFDQAWKFLYEERSDKFSFRNGEMRRTEKKVLDYNLETVLAALREDQMKNLCDLVYSKNEDKFWEDDLFLKPPENFSKKGKKRKKSKRAQPKANDLTKYLLNKKTADLVDGLKMDVKNSKSSPDLCPGLVSLSANVGDTKKNERRQEFAKVNNVKQSLSEISLVINSIARDAVRSLAARPINQLFDKFGMVKPQPATLGDEIIGDILKDSAADEKPTENPSDKNLLASILYNKDFPPKDRMDIDKAAIEHLKSLGLDSDLISKLQSALKLVAKERSTSENVASQARSSPENIPSETMTVDNEEPPVSQPEPSKQNQFYEDTSGRNSGKVPELHYLNNFETQQAKVNDMLTSSNENIPVENRDELNYERYPLGKKCAYPNSSDVQITAPCNSTESFIVQKKMSTSVLQSDSYFRQAPTSPRGCTSCGGAVPQGPPANEADNFSQQASRTSYKGQLNACPRFCNNGNQTSNINNQGGRESAAFHVAVDNGNGVENSFKDPSNSIENCNCPSPNANQNSRVSYSFNDTSNVYAVSQIQTASPFKRCYSPNAQNSPKYQQSESSRSSHYLPTSPSHCSRDYMGEAIQTRNKKTAFMSEINLNVPPKYCHCDRKYCCCNATDMSSRSIPNMNSPHVFPDKSCPSFGLDYECKPTNRLPVRMLDPAKKHYEVCEQMGPGENPAFYHRAFEQLQSSASCEDSRTGMSLPTNDDCSCRNSDKELQDSNKS